MAATRHSLARAIPVLAVLATTLLVGPAAFADFSPPPDQDQYHTNGGHRALDIPGVGDPVVPDSLPLGGKPLEMVSADFNSDGQGDFAAITTDRYGPEEAWWFPTGVAVLLSQPDGGYANAVLYHTGFELRSYSALTDLTPLSCCPTAEGGERGPRDLTTADVNDDGATDLAVVNAWTNSVSVLTNTGAGAFTPPEHISVDQQGPRHIAAANFDGQHGDDLAVTDHDDVHLLFSDASGRYSDGGTRQQANVDNPGTLSSADFDGQDGIDLAVHVGGAVKILLNDGSGNLSTSTGPFDVGDRPQSLDSADLDADGDQDLATANRKSDDVSVLLNDGAANLSAEADSPYPITADLGGPTDLILANLNPSSDQHIDIAVAQPHGNFVEVLRHDGTLDDGNGSFNAEPNSPYDVAGDHPLTLTVGNFDGDSTGPDLATGDQASGTITVLHNQ